MLKLLSYMLANLGYTDVSLYDNGSAALACINSPDNAPNLILLDLNMPEMDGLEFVRHLVERHYVGSVILVSGEDERMQQAAEKLAIAHKVTVLGHLHKPASPEKLMALLEKWVDPSQQTVLLAKKVYSADVLRQAIENDQLVNYYQPKVWTATGQVMGVETLVRWQHPVDGIVFPDQFISVVEAHGLIDDLTRVVLTHALADAKIWQAAGLNLQVAVNLSMDNLVSSDYPDFVTGLAAQAGVSPSTIVLEVTESRLMADLRIPLEILTRLRLKRFRLSIDDFGIGNSTLAQLRDLPFDELKIDQSFVHGAWGDEKLRAMFHASLGLAQQLGLESVAEGVEDLADWEFVCRAGCDIAQGYFIAKPMPAAALPAWILSWTQAPHIINRPIE